MLPVEVPREYSQAICSFVVAMRVLILEPSGNLWGSERVLLDFLHAAASANDWTIGVCCPPATPILPELARLAVEVLPTFPANLHQKSKVSWLRAAVGLIRTVARFRPELIHVNQAGATRMALLAGRVLKLPVVTHVRLAEDVRYIEALRAAPRALPKIICISRHIRHMFGAASSVEPKQLTIKQLTMMYDPYRARCNWSPRALSGDTSTRAAFSCIGRLATIKGQDVLLHAIAVLAREGTDAEVSFVGTAGLGDDFGTELQRLSAQLKITERVNWAGFQRDAVSFIEGSAALVCPSHEEPLGRVIFEAWDAGTVPVAWAGSGGPAEVIEACDGGVLYEEQNGQSLANALKKVMAFSDDERYAMISRGRAWLREQCDPRRYTDEMLELWCCAAEG